MTSNGAIQRCSQVPDNSDVDQLLHPSRVYARPADVATDELLTIEERRAILSSWASDACAVESHPALRKPPDASVPVTFDEIMDALTELDRRKKTSNTAPGAWWPRQGASPAPAVSNRSRSRTACHD